MLLKKSVLPPCATALLTLSSIAHSKVIKFTKIDDEGLHYVENEAQKVLAVDNVIICAGQLPFKELLEPLEAKGIKVHVIGGADVAAELDAKRAINQASRLAAII